MGDQIDATNKLVQQQQEQLEHQQQELEALQANQNQNYTPGVASSPRGGCDKDVETTATHRGGDKFAAGDFNKALGYYQDALMACPNDERAEVNVARTYEALGNKVAAINLYRKVADTDAAPTAPPSATPRMKPRPRSCACKPRACPDSDPSPVRFTGEVR